LFKIELVWPAISNLNVDGVIRNWLPGYSTDFGWGQRVLNFAVVETAKIKTTSAKNVYNFIKGQVNCGDGRMGYKVRCWESRGGVNNGQRLFLIFYTKIVSKKFCQKLNRVLYEETDRQIYYNNCKNVLL